MGASVLLVLGGLALLAVGGDLVVRGSVAVARRLDVSPIVIGVVLIGFGTSLPELVTSIDGALKGEDGIALGNVVGSNIANLLLVAGLAAFLSGPAIQKVILNRDGPVMLFASVVLALALYSGGVSRILGAGLLVLLASYLFWTVMTARSGREPLDPSVDDAPKGVGVGLGLLLFGVGLAAILFGADWLVVGAIDIATALDVPKALIGVTVVAIGTSAPELAATIAAAVKNKPELALGNVFGSNVFNSFGIVGTTALVTPLETPPSLMTIDVWAMLIASAAVLIFARSDFRLSKSEGALLLLAYAGYLGLTVSFAL